MQFYNGEDKFEISVMVPIYNVEPYIKQALLSIFTQTKTEGVEFILINDATPDNSMEIAREVVAQFPNLEVVFLENEVNLGRSLTRQKALAAARGEYLTMLDSDDWFDSTMLEEMLAAVRADGADIVGCDIFDNINSVDRYHSCPVISDSGLKNAISVTSGKQPPYLCTKLFKRSLLDGGNLHLIEDLNIWEDGLLVIQLYINAQRVVYLPKAFCHYRRDSIGSISKDMTYEKLKDYFKVLRYVMQRADESGLHKLYRAAVKRFYKIRARAILVENGKVEVTERCLHPALDDAYIWLFSGLSLRRRFMLTLNKARKGRKINRQIVIKKRRKQIRNRQRRYKLA